jgi:hypothetical protein
MDRLTAARVTAKAKHATANRVRWSTERGVGHSFLARVIDSTDELRDLNTARDYFRGQGYEATVTSVGRRGAYKGIAYRLRVTDTGAEQAAQEAQAEARTKAIEEGLAEVAAARAAEETPAARVARERAERGAARVAALTEALQRGQDRGWFTIVAGGVPVGQASGYADAEATAESHRARGTGATVYGPCCHPLDRLRGGADCRRCIQVRQAAEVLRAGRELTGYLRAAGVEGEARDLIGREAAAARAEEERAAAEAEAAAIVVPSPVRDALDAVAAGAPVVHHRTQADPDLSYCGQPGPAVWIIAEGVTCPACLLEAATRYEAHARWLRRVRPDTSAAAAEQDEAAAAAIRQQLAAQAPAEPAQGAQDGAGAVCGVFTSDGREGSGTGWRCGRPAGHPHDGALYGRVTAGNHAPAPLPQDAPDAAPAIVEAVAATLDEARAAGRLLAATTVKPWNGGVIVTVEEHPTDTGASNHRAYDVRLALGRAGWATRPAGLQVIVEGRAATGRQADTLARAGEPYTEPLVDERIGVPYFL